MKLLGTSDIFSLCIYLLLIDFSHLFSVIFTTLIKSFIFFYSPISFSSQEEDGEEAASTSKRSRKIEPSGRNLLQKKSVSAAKLDPDVRVSWSGDRFHAVDIPKDAPVWRKIFIRGNQVR